MAIFNCTPHVINIFTIDDVDNSNSRRLYLKDSTIKPKWVFNPCGVILNAQIDRQSVGYLSNTGIPLVKPIYLSIDDPLDVADSTPDDWFIVSALYKTAALTCDSSFRFLSVDSVIYDYLTPDNIRPVGCLNLSI